MVSPTQDPQCDRKFLMPSILPFRPSDAKLQRVDNSTQSIRNEPNKYSVVTAHNETSSSVNSVLGKGNTFNGDSVVNGTAKTFSFDSGKMQPGDQSRVLNCNTKLSTMPDAFKAADGEKPNTFKNISNEINIEKRHTEPITHKAAEESRFFSSLISLGPPVPLQTQTQTVFPVFRSAEDIRVEKRSDQSSLTNNHLSLLTMYLSHNPQRQKEGCFLDCLSLHLVRIQVHPKVCHKTPSRQIKLFLPQTK